MRSARSSAIGSGRWWTGTARRSTRFCRTRCSSSTNGKRETKQQFIDAIVAGRRRYRQIEIQSQDVLPVGDETCVVTGRALIEMETNNGGLVFPIAYTSVHTHQQALEPVRVAGDAVRDRDMSARGAPFMS